jgi:hypothetical protein
MTIFYLLSGLGLWCLMPPIFQSYRGNQFSW